MLDFIIVSCYDVTINMTATTTGNTITDPVSDYRVAMFEELGFSHGEAECLRDAYKSVNVNGNTYHMKLSHHDVRKHMEQGASAHQILAIFT